MKTMKKFFILVLLICTIAITASCTKDKPKVTPQLTDPSSSFLKIGNFNVTKNEAYHQLLNSYGSDTIMEMIDEALLPSLTDEEGFQENLDEIIYGDEDDEEKRQENAKEFYDNLILAGLSQNESDPNYYMNYYRLQYRRFVFAKQYYIDHLAEDYFKDEDIEDYFETKYRKKNDLIIIAFDSNVNAKEVMEANNIDFDHLNTGWQNSEGTSYTDEEILAIFEKMYNFVNNTESASGIKTYEYTDLTTINTSLASYAYNLDVKGYSKAPLSYGSKVYLVYKNAETANLDEEGNDITLTDEIKEKIKDNIIEDNVSNVYVSMVMQKNQLLHNLKIYDKGVENFYRMSYENVYNSLGYSTGDYPKFAKTTAESDKNVCSYVVDGVEKVITADEVYNKLTTKYANYLASLYMKQYFVLKDNGVYDLATGQILDKDKYQDYYDEEVQEYKTAFENGDYASLGYDSSYGWENFIRDYLGLLSEEKIIVNLDSSLYNDNLDDFKKTLYLLENPGKDEEGNDIPVDKLVQDKMQEIYDKYLNVTAIGISAYYDKDLDGTADEITVEEGEPNPNEDLAKELLATVYAKVVEKRKAISTALTEIVLEYNIASLNNDNTWKKFKTAGLKLQLMSSTSYTATSNSDEIILNQLRKQYAKFLAYPDAENGVDLHAINLSEKYVYNKNDVTYIIRPTDSTFMNVDLESEDNDLIMCEDKAYLYFVTQISRPPYRSISDKTFKPTYDEYTKYLNKASDVISSVRTLITTYYVPAINELTTDKIVNNALIEKVKELLDSVEFAGGNKTSLKAYLDACVTPDEE